MAVFHTNVLSKLFIPFLTKIDQHGGLNASWPPLCSPSVCWPLDAVLAGWTYDDRINLYSWSQRLNSPVTDSVPGFNYDSTILPSHDSLKKNPQAQLRLKGIASNGVCSSVCLSGYALAGWPREFCLSNDIQSMCLPVYQIPCPLECPGCFCLTQPVDRFFIFSAQSLNRNGHAAQTKPAKTNKITKMAKWHIQQYKAIIIINKAEIATTEFRPGSKRSM